MQKTRLDRLSAFRNSSAGLLAWWYATIAAGFVVLAVVHLLQGDKPWLIGVRLVIAAGFAVLARFEFHAKNRRR